MSTSSLKTIVVVMLMMVLTNSAAWAVPELISYEGKLTDSNGVSLNGTYEIVFNMYNTEAGGDAIWSEQQTVTVTDGIFNVHLGSIEPFPSGVFETDHLFLEVAISGQLLLPRQRFTSAAFAIKAKDADTVDGKHANELGGGGAGDGNSLDAADGDPADALFVDANGNVGIGTTSPEAKLHILSIRPSSLKIEGQEASTGGHASLVFQEQGTPNIWFLSQRGQAALEGENYLAFISYDGTSYYTPLKIAHRAPSDALVITSDSTLLLNGNVGIGTTSPSEKLDVSGTVKASAFVGDGSGLTGIAEGTGGIENTGSTTIGADTGSNGVGEIAFQTQKTTRMTVTNSGNIGIGTTSPEAKLHIFNGASGASNHPWDSLIVEDDIRTYINIMTPHNVERGILFGDNLKPVDGGIIYNSAASPDGLQLRTNGNLTRMSITNDGNVGIGTTSPIRRLHIYRPTVASEMVMEVGDGMANWRKWNLYTDGGTGAKQNFRLRILNDAGTASTMEAMTWLNNGNVGIGTTSPSKRLHVAGSAAISGNLGIGTTNPQQKMHISGVMRLEPQSSPPSGALGDLYVGTDGKLYFHNGTEWKAVLLQ